MEKSRKEYVLQVMYKDRTATHVDVALDLAWPFGTFIDY